MSPPDESMPGSASLPTWLPDPWMGTTVPGQSVPGSLLGGESAHAPEGAPWGLIALGVAAVAVPVIVIASRKRRKKEQ